MVDYDDDDYYDTDDYDYQFARQQSREAELEKVEKAAAGSLQSI